MAMTREASTADLIRLIPQLAQMAHQTGIDRDEQALAQQKAIFEQDKAMKELQLQERELALKERQSQQEAGSQGVATVPNSTQAIGPPGAAPGASGGNTSMATDMSTNLT